MTNEELLEFLEALKKFHEELDTPEKAREYLKKLENRDEMD